MTGKAGRSGHKKGQKNKPKKKPVTQPGAMKKEPPKVVPHPTAGPKILDFEKAIDDKIRESEQVEQGPQMPAPGPQPGLQRFDYDIIKPAIAMPFDLWSARIGVDKLKLTNTEQNLLAKPIKELLDYYLPQIPVIAWAWISVSIASYSVMKVRLELLAEIRKQKTAGSGDTDGRKEPTNPTPPANNPNFPTIDDIKQSANQVT